MNQTIHRVVCPGTFDPVTLGHTDIFRRASRMFDEVIVAIGVNGSKNRLFTPDERMEMLREVTSELPNVRVRGFTGLIVDFCTEQGAQGVVKGLRDGQDLAYEQPMAQMNSRLSGLETVYLGTDPSLAFVSSSLVKEVAAMGGDVTPFLAPVVHRRLMDRLTQRG